MNTTRFGFILSAPTACGKTALSIELAKKYYPLLEIINFDSIAFYKELPILSACPSLKEWDNIAHHLFSIQSIHEELNAHLFVSQCIPIIENIFSRGRIPLLVGGSGFYLKALIHGMYDSPTTPKEIKEKSHKLYSEVGIAPFWKELEIHDPELTLKYHPNDHYRIIRAVEHFWTHQSKFSLKRANHQSQNLLLNAPFFHIHMNLSVEELQPRILERIDNMFNQGALEEINNLLVSGVSPDLPALKSVGPKQVVEYILNKEQRGLKLSYCKEQIFIATRQLAKAQRTWFKSQHGQLTIYHAIKDKNAIFEQFSLYLEKLNRP